MAVEDYIDFEYDGDWDEGATCSRCGAMHLDWDFSYRFSRWRLYNEDGTVHRCHQVNPEELFDDLGE